MNGPLPENWRQFGIIALRAWVTRHPDRPKYVVYKRKHELIAWIEQHVGQP